MIFLKNLIQKYDYAGALTVAESMPSEETRSYIDWLRMAYLRDQLDLRGVSQILGRSGMDYLLPVRDAELCKYFEFALTLQVRIWRGEYADFVRALSPILAWLFDRILKTQTSIQVDEYCYRDKKKIRKWDRNKLEQRGQEILSILVTEFPDFRYGTVYGSTFVPLIEHYCRENTALCKLVRDLRTVEQEVRNLAAHEVQCVTDETIQKLTGFTSNQIMAKVRKAYGYAGMNIREEQWQSYEEMNERIIAAIGQQAT